MQGIWNRGLIIIAMNGIKIMQRTKSNFIPVEEGDGEGGEKKEVEQRDNKKLDSLSVNDFSNDLESRQRWKK